MYYSLAETEKTLDEVKIKMFNKDEALEKESLEKAYKILAKEKKSLVKVNAMMEDILNEEMQLTQAKLKEIKAEQQVMKERMSKWHTVLTKELTEDGIIKGGEQATVVLSTNEMLVNDKKQSKKTHEKYLKFFSKVRGKPLTGGDVPHAFLINSKSK